MEEVSSNDDIILNFDIIDYMGKIDDAVIVLLSISVDDLYTESIFYYSNEIFSIAVEDSIKELIGGEIEYWKGYLNLIESIFKRLVPYDEIIQQLVEIEKA